MAKVFLVLGAESSGTKLVTELLISAGVIGDADDVQRWDTQALPLPTRDLVWRRSLPHAGAWPNLNQMAKKVRQANYGLSVVVTFREMTALIASQVRAGHVPTKAQAQLNIPHAYWSIFDFIGRYDLQSYVMLYESIILHPGPTVKGLLDWAGLSFEHSVIPYIYDGNVKYYGSQNMTYDV